MSFLSVTFVNCFLGRRAKVHGDALVRVEGRQGREDQGGPDRGGSVPPQRPRQPALLDLAEQRGPGPEGGGQEGLHHRHEGPRQVEVSLQDQDQQGRGQQEQAQPRQPCTFLDYHIKYKYPPTTERAFCGCPNEMRLKVLKYLTII